MKRRIGGVSWLAARKNLDASTTDTNENAPTVEEVNELLGYLKCYTLGETSVKNVQNTETDETLTPEELIRRKMQKLMNRLIPYSKYLQGTPMQILHEKAKLMALLPSPIIAKEGTWRWFSTFAPADLYENRLFEILSEIENPEDYKGRESSALKLTQDERTKLLRSHPALSARLFHLKQECIWNSILLGENAPLFRIVDFWRRIEVSYNLEIHYRHSYVIIVKLYSL